MAQESCPSIPGGPGILPGEYGRDARTTRNAVTKSCSVPTSLRHDPPALPQSVNQLAAQNTEQDCLHSPQCGFGRRVQSVSASFNFAAAAQKVESRPASHIGRTAGFGQDACAARCGAFQPPRIMPIHRASAMASRNMTSTTPNQKRGRSRNATVNRACQLAEAAW